MQYKERIKQLYTQMRCMNLTQMLITDPFSIYYLIGKKIEPMERFLALYISPGQIPVLFLNQLFYCPEDLDVKKVWIEDQEDVVSLLSQTVDSARTLGVDKNLPARFLLSFMENQVASAYMNASNMIDMLREVKDPEEQKRMETSSHINDTAMQKIKELIREGMTELEMAEMLPAIYKKLGAERGAGMVCFGVNAADPHHKADDTTLKKGDVILLDIGGAYDNYCSDMTRTFFFKEMSEKQRKVYEIVLRANLEAEKAIRPGIPLSNLDKKAREVIVNAGYGRYFIHRLGHFIGLQVHEAGDVSASNHKLVRPGMIFSIEPGIYIPGEFGIRIEDLVLVTENGCKVLNKFPKKLQLL